MNVMRLRTWPRYLQYFVAAFVVVGLAGYAAGLGYIAVVTGPSPEDVGDHYHGNEAEMSFGKSTGEMLTIIHTHLLGMGVLFLAVGLLFAASDFPTRLKGAVMVETMLTLFTTFGGLYVVSIGWRAWLWVVYPSSVLMVIGYLTMSVAILRSAFRPLSVPTSDDRDRLSSDAYRHESRVQQS
ncbi:MAG: hypothetical protein GF341_01415 [candidate division Zixibacteria bacterium]|nr:hypothetical protein [candidate division Zixibacteria bacterium]